MDNFIILDKQKRWKEDLDLESIREYNRWKAKNWRIKHKKYTIKIYTEEEKKEKEKNKIYYLKNKEHILNKYKMEKKYVWVDIRIEDRNFVLNFNPNDYPKYLEKINEIKKS